MCATAFHQDGNSSCHLPFKGMVTAAFRFPYVVKCSRCLAMCQCHSAAALEVARRLEPTVMVAIGGEGRQGPDRDRAWQGRQRRGVAGRHEHHCTATRAAATLKPMIRFPPSAVDQAQRNLRKFYWQGQA
jgi:hypothetical protein